MRCFSLYFFSILLFAACKQAGNKPFTLVSPSDSKVNFKNTLIEDESFNVLNYPYFYNGGGVAIGDVNNDGLPDLFFTGNMVKNRLYLNKGELAFEDITATSTVADKQGWCTGATMVDINADGWLDIYVCRSADANPVKRRNLLFINNHNNTFTESAEQFGIADEGYSTHAAFFDYDRDNDLDLVVMNHSQKEYMQGAQEKPGIRNIIDPNFSTHLYRNDNGHFTNVSDAAGVTSNVLTFGLGLAVSDLNNDGWPDIYISNDFNEADYCFINQKNGTFRESSREMFAYTSLFSMGNDAADINNDGLQDIVTLDMLPEGNLLQKMHNGSENFNKFQILFNNGFFKQYSRNMLQLNRGDGSFDEVGQFAGISNTDWSWTPLVADFDDDGRKDIFITNGYVKDYTDMDYIKYNVDIIIEKDREKQLEMMRNRMDKLPTIKMANYMFRNEGDAKFSNQTMAWGLAEPTISAGAAYADLDNDGDLDIVMNNSNEIAAIYQNNHHELKSPGNYLNIKLEGTGMNRLAIGSTVTLTMNSGIQTQELMPSRGFQSSVDYTLHFGIGPNDSVKSIKVHWPTGEVTEMPSSGMNKTITINIKSAVADPPAPANPIQPLLVFSDSLPFRHTENSYNDFTQQGLLPQWFSRQGPAMAKGDLNGDGLDDIFIGGAKDQAGVIFLKTKSGQWTKLLVPAIVDDAAFEDITAAIFDADGDGDNDLFVGSGGYELQAQDPLLQNRLYTNNGKGSFTKSTNALPADLINDNAIAIADFNQDGFMDIFNGGFCIPGRYPEASGTQVLINDGKGRFTSQPQWLKGINKQHLVTAAVSADMNKDGLPDLVLTGHFMGVELWMNRSGHFERDTSFTAGMGNGLYNTIVADDLDGDGDIDLVAGNQGLNNQYVVNASEPLELFYADFDDNGTAEPVMAYYIDHKLWPIYSQDDLMQQIPSYNKRYLFYSDYAKADMAAIFGGKLQKATHYSAADMQTVVLENTGKSLLSHPLPAEAQWYPIYSIAIFDADGDGKKDIITSGNQSFSRIKFGAYSSGRGDVFSNKGALEFTRVPPVKSGLRLNGDARNSLLLKDRIIFGLNNQQPLVYRFGH